MNTKAKRKKPLGRPRALVCCCCGGRAIGRQWWNRDTGFGLCDDCVTFVGIKPAEAYVSAYGHRGVHFDLGWVPPVAIQTCPGCSGECYYIEESPDGLSDRRVACPVCDGIGEIEVKQ